MAVGTVSTSILTDIANAIRYKAGVATLYKPREMAAAVSALDGTDAGDYQEQPYMTLESGVLPESVFSDIAAAIRGQNGLSALYQPGDMAAAILALEWDAGLKPRAVLTSLGTLEFNYVDGRHCYSGGVPVNAWEIDPAGYSSAAARPYDSIKLQVKKVVIHSSWPQVGMRKADYLCNAFQSMTEVSGFENASGITSAAQSSRAARRSRRSTPRPSATRGSRPRSCSWTAASPSTGPRTARSRSPATGPPSTPPPRTTSRPSWNGAVASLYSSLLSGI